MSLAVSSGAELVAAFEAMEARRTFSRPELAARRRERLLASPAGFFRGAPELFYALVKSHHAARALLGRDRRFIVGDVHLENIGVISVGDRRLVYEFNDLDESVRASPVLDVLRGAASAAVSALELGYGPRVALAAAEAFLVSYLRPLAEDPPRVVRALLTQAQGRTHEQLLDERCPVQNGVRRFVLGKRYMALLAEEKPVAEALFAEYARKQPLPWVKKKLRLEDAAFRVQGTGSLGVRRFIFLVREGKHGQQLLIEAKEMRRSAVVRGGLLVPAKRGDSEAARVARAIESMLVEPQEGVRAVRGVDKRSYLVRLHAPGEDKLTITALKDPNELLALARMIGFRLSLAHERAGGAPPPAIQPNDALAVALDLALAMDRAHLALLTRAQATASRA